MLICDPLSLNIETPVQGENVIRRTIEERLTPLNQSIKPLFTSMTARPN